jgi:hypothetical protein
MIAKIAAYLYLPVATIIAIAVIGWASTYATPKAPDETSPPSLGQSDAITGE